MAKHLIGLGLLAGLLLAGPALANEPVNLEGGSQHQGNLETRNSPIRVGNDVQISGNVTTRNGSITLGDSVQARDLDSRNGPIRAGDHGQFRSVSSRNGAIHLGGQSQSEDVSTRNGAIDIGPGSRVRSLESRNGSLTVGDDSEVARGLDTRNGAITVGTEVIIGEGVQSRNGAVRIGQGSQVGETIETRNGSIQLHGVRAKQSVISRGGDITLDKGSHVEGDVAIIIEQGSGSQSGFLWWSASSYNDAGNIHVLGGSVVAGDVLIELPKDYDGADPILRVDADSQIQGTLKVDQRVALEIADGAQVGEVERQSP